MKFETWLFRAMAKILENGEWEIKHRKNLNSVEYVGKKRFAIPVWGETDRDKNAIFIEFLDEKTIDGSGIEKSPGKNLILFHELAHIVFEDYFSFGEISEKDGEEKKAEMKNMFKNHFQIIEMLNGKSPKTMKEKDLDNLKKLAKNSLALVGQIEEMFILLVEIFYWKLSKTQKTYLESFLPQGLKTKKTKKSR